MKNSAVPANEIKIEIVTADPVGAVARGLIERLCAEMAGRYGTPPSPFSSTEAATSRTVFLVARSDGEAVACGALRPWTDEIGEIKRMYVAPEARRRGLARRILGELERHAASFGYRTLRLETGIRQPEAQELYADCGFGRIPAFGPYLGNPTSVCFEKSLDVAQELDGRGFAQRSGVLSVAELEALRVEADRVAMEAGSVCVRNLLAKSEPVRMFARDVRWRAWMPGDLIPVRGLLFDKTPTENWPVAWHQDTTIAVAERVEVSGYGPWSVKDGVPHVQPPAELLDRMVTLRIHLDDTPAENGALRVIPGSHRQGRLAADGIARWRGVAEYACACRAGEVLLMKPLLLHASSRSERPVRRRVVHVEYAPRGALPAPLNWVEGRSA